MLLNLVLQLSVLLLWTAMCSPVFELHGSQSMPGPLTFSLPHRVHAVAENLGTEGPHTYFSVIRLLKFSVLKYGCESWTLNKTWNWHMQSFEHWYYRRIMRISWEYQMSRYYAECEKKSYISGKILWNRNWHMLDVLRGSSGFNALLVLEGKFDGRRTRGRPRKTWTDDVIQWMQKKKYDEVKRLAEDRDT